MPSSVKQRPRKHVIASISVHATALVVSRCGHAVDVPDLDYGTDMAITTFHPKTRDQETEFIQIQLKATEKLKTRADLILFDAETRDLRTWNHNLLPFFLVVFDIKTEQGYWLHIQAYLKEKKIDPKKLKGEHKRVYIPKTQVVDEAAVAIWRNLKETRAEELRQ